ncbi:MAG: hypothetical protein P8171_09165 [Candidatus Thiodiazotropha sp.]
MRRNSRSCCGARDRRAKRLLPAEPRVGKRCGSIELFENGKKIGSFKGTCSILGRCVKALGKDISEWLINPTMNARLGEM